MKPPGKISPSLVALVVIGLFYLIYSEIKFRETKHTYVVTTSDALFYHEYIAVHLFGMEPYIPREKKPVIKYSMGMAVTYMPAIGIGYVYTQIKGIDHDYGRNYIYQKLLYYLGFGYAFLGLIFLRLLLRRWLSDWIIVCVLACIFFGTNLYYYVKVAPLMSHGASFAFITAFMYYSLKYLEQPGWKNALAMGSLLAITTLIRPVNLIILLLPGIYWLASAGGLAVKLSFIKKNFIHVIIMAGLVGIAFIPQMIYWHTYTGEWFYYSYQQEKFFWDRPALLQVLFSFRKGWLIYTPIMFFIIPGAVICYKKNKPLFWSVLIFSLVNIYIISCWWCWWYGGGFGMRPMIDSYGILGIWLGLFLQEIVRRSKIFFVSILACMGFLVYVNLYQTRQARICMIHYDSMNYAAYKIVFLNESNHKNYTPEEWQQLLSPPDYEKAFVGKRFW
jgi:hypothetical protein